MLLNGDEFLFKIQSRIKLVLTKPRNSMQMPQLLSQACYKTFKVPSNNLMPH
jgi:hypothetical protein